MGCIGRNQPRLKQIGWFVVILGFANVSCGSVVPLCNEDNCVAAIETQWAQTTGWLDSEGNLIQMTFREVEPSSARYECRTGHESVVADIAFSACDGVDGKRPVHVPTATPNMEEGHYLTHMRVVDDEFRSDVVEYPFYVHGSLDRAKLCSSVFTDEEIFAAAAAGAVLPKAKPFLNTVDDQPGSVTNPFIRIAFDEVSVTDGMRNDGQGTWTEVDQTNQADLIVSSLRRRFTYNPDRTLLLVQRQYESRRAIGQGDNDAVCQNGFRFSGRIFDCENFVLNSRGQSICLVNENGILTPRESSDVGWVKLFNKKAFSVKGNTAECPKAIFGEGACNLVGLYLFVPN